MSICLQKPMTHKLLEFLIHCKLIKSKLSFCLLLYCLKSRKSFSVSNIQIKHNHINRAVYKNFGASTSQLSTLSEAIGMRKCFYRQRKRFTGKLIINNKCTLFYFKLLSIYIVYFLLLVAFFSGICA